jgi:hypothetical protein
MIVMVVVRASPNAAGTQDQNAKEAHQALRQSGMGQYGLVLLVVINYEKPKMKQSCQHAAYDFSDKTEIPECPRQRARQENRG